jgi:hypothetical protein
MSCCFKKWLPKSPVLSKSGEICRLEGKSNIKISSSGKPVSFNTLANGNIEFKTVKGGVYVIE